MYKKLYLHFIWIAFIAFPSLVQSATQGPVPPRDSGPRFKNPLRDDIGTIGKFFEAVLKVVVLVGFPIVVLAIVYGGFLLVTARGDMEKLEKRKRTLL